MICQRCKKEINEDAIYCPHCGLKLEKCPSCLQPIIPGSRFCSSCGKEIRQKEQESQMEGYYQPLGQSHHIDNWEQDIKEETTQETSFQDVGVSHKINKKVIVISVIILALVTTVGYMYVKNGSDIEFKEEEGQLIPSETLTISSTNSFSTYTANINQNGDAFFDGQYLFVLDNQGKIIKMDSELNNKGTLVDTKSQYLTVVDKTLYYTNESNQLCRISTDMKNQEVIIDKEVFYPIIKDDKVYYQLDEDNESIHVYDLSSKKDIKVNDRHSYHINVAGDKIYYTSDDGIYVIGIDGQGEEKIVSGSEMTFVYQDEKLYYSYEGALCAYNVKTKKIETLVSSDAYVFLNINNEYIYYLNERGNIKRYELSTQDIKSIYNGQATGLFIVGDKLIINTAKTSLKDSEKIAMDLNGDIQQVIFTENNGKFI